METTITNKEETLEFTYITEVKQYRIKALPKHPYYAKFNGNTEGGIIKDPNYIGYDCWVSGGCVVKGMVLDGTILLSGKYGGLVDAGCVIRDSYVDVGKLSVMNRSEINGLTVSGLSSPDIKLEVKQSILSAKVNIWLNLSREELSDISGVKITNSIITGTTTMNSANLTIEDSNLSEGPFIIDRGVRVIQGVFKSEAFEFKEEEYGI
jgi:hypothetical protein